MRYSIRDWFAVRTPLGVCACGAKEGEQCRYIAEHNVPQVYDNGYYPRCAADMAKPEEYKEWLDGDSIIPDGWRELRK